MADGNDTFVAPLFTFRFDVKFVRESIGGSRSSGAEDLCQGAFSEVSGLEATLEPKAIKEGGMNYGAHQRAGPVTFGTLVLKRGVTTARHLWQWWALLTGATGDAQSKTGAYAHRMTVTITLKDAMGQPQMRWRIERAMPVKFKAADFNARATEVGIEELHLAHEGLYAEAL